MHTDLFETDTLADSTLHELGEIPLDVHDEYDELWEYAGCYPWLDQTVHLHPHVASLSEYVQSDEIGPFTL